MITTVTLENATIYLNGRSFEDILLEVYNKGRADGSSDTTNGVVSLEQLAVELSLTGRIISSRSLISKARKANVKTFRFDGNKLASLRKDIIRFLG